MAAARNARWLLVEWSDESRCVVNVRAVVDGAQQLKVGDEVTVTVRGAKRLGKLVNYSDDRKGLDVQVKPERAEQETTRPETEGPNLYEDLEAGDFSPSGSSWGPDEQQHTSDSEADVSQNEVDSKKIKLDSIKRQYSNKGNKMRTPTLRPEPVIPKSEQTLKQSQLNFSSKVPKRKLDQNRSLPVQQAIADSTRSQVCASPRVPLYNKQRPTNKQTISISGDELAKVKNDLRHFKDVISGLKSAVASLRSTLSADYLYETIYATKAEDPLSIPNGDGPIKPKEEPNMANESTEAIQPVRYGLIQHNPNRRRKLQVQPPSANITSAMRKHRRLANLRNSSPDNEHSGEENDKLVPIGTGKTLVPKSVYVRINWDSYTMATRKLLVAVFPRRILATHSLTGKASPAFTDRPAKLCLDPKKVSDVAMEVTKRCKIKESLVRSVITTKCADEYKMFRMQCDKEKLRKSKHTPSFRLLNNHENLPPEGRLGPTEGFQSTSYNLGTQ